MSRQRERPEDVRPRLEPQLTDTRVDSRSTFGLDVDTGTYSHVRRLLNAGRWPEPEQVRVEEMVNYFDYGDLPPQEGDFALSAEGGPNHLARRPNSHWLRVHVQARDVSPAQRPAALLVFVVDISGSMARVDRLPLVKKSLQLLLQQLRSDDRVALVVYGSRGRVVLEPTADLERIDRAIDSLRNEGATNVQEGLELAYELAAKHRRPGDIHRVILCSDGVANVGATSSQGLLEAVDHHARQGIELTTVGFGMGDYSDALMEQLADSGNGRYAYVDQVDEAHRLFVENLTGTLQTVAAEARAQLVFDERTVLRYRLLGYENRDIEDHRFRDDRTDGGEIGAGHSVTALYQLELAPSVRPDDNLGILYLRYASISEGEMVELAYPIRRHDLAPDEASMSPSLQLSTLVADFAESLRQGPNSRQIDLDDLLRRGQRLSSHFLGDRDVAELVGLIAKAADQRERRSQ